MIGSDLDIERQTPGNSNMEAGNGMAKTYQYYDNGKLSNSDQNQQKKYNLRSREANEIVGKKKSNHVDFKRIEKDESNINHVQEDED